MATHDLPRPAKSRHAALRLVTAVVLAALGASFAAEAGLAAAAPTWQAPTTLSTPGTRASSVQVGLSASGSAIAVWEEQVDRACNAPRNGPTCDVVVRGGTRNRSGAWAPAHEVSRAGGVSSLRLAVSPVGAALAAWRRWTTPTESSVESAYHHGVWAPWGDPTAGMARGGPFEIALDRAGNAVSIWTEALPTILRVGYRPLFSAWAAPVELDRAEAIFGATATFDNAGNMTAVWVSLTPARVWVVKSARRLAATGTWTAPVLVATLSGSPTAPSVGVDADGNAVAVWTRLGEDRQVVEAVQRRGGSDTWSAPVEISPPSRTIVAPQIAVAPTGDAVAVWSRADGSNLRVQAAARSGRDGRWGEAVDLSAPGGSAAGAGVAVDARGDAVAIWHRYDGARDVVQASLRPAGLARWLAPTDVAPGFAPTVALDESGNGLAAWGGGTVGAASLTAGPLVDVAAPAAARVGDALELTASASPWGTALAGEPVWTLGDGRTARGARVVTRYSRPGSYRVTVTQRDSSGGSSTAAAAISIAERPEPSLIAIGRSIGRVRIGMTRAEVVRAYGAPKAETHARLADGRNGRQARFVHARGTLTVVYGGARVVAVETSSPYYRTAAGVGPGSSRAAAAKLRGFRWTGAAYSRRAGGVVTSFVPRGRVVHRARVALATVTARRF